ncbi:hypothetical protein XIS1_600060 [Xenorhabdus innexi]|uniref:Uncharacterized protein n=1 Tax=Xenorhabdus innexi TaxID=290109 RepID=A0A1N6MZT4_9GAMM|nr:hypothetical protein XIS1_600060 [Xenorhabdus innexi]
MLHILIINVFYLLIWLYTLVFQVAFLLIALMLDIKLVIKTKKAVTTNNSHYYNMLGKGKPTVIQPIFVILPLWTYKKIK